ncbi:unnamed protein product [Cuscuta europaea]|uniref:DUF4216 domain-containing protein n=1 Tax=Cuscuta europaea TaxID=41803 RepID=A0A9P0ZUC1_CUSEU|nr:unnamed protein product [Cuscuta europaea]
MVKCTSSDGLALVYYGLIHEIIQLEYQDFKIIVFRCEWFEPSCRGTRLHPLYNIVDVNTQHRLRTSDCYSLASQADQVVYVPYPNTKKRVNRWVSVIQCMPRAFVMRDLGEDSTHEDEDFQVFQEDEPMNSFQIEVDEQQFPISFQRRERRTSERQPVYRTTRI